MFLTKELAAKIAALKAEDFKFQLITGVDRLKKFRAAEVEILLDFNFHVPDFSRMMGCVNSRPIGLAPAGCVMLTGLSIDHDGAKARFSIRRSIPWNRGLPIDAAGRKPYRKVDFNTLPDWLRCTHPG